MAILRGFSPSNTLSAGVRIAEKDLSFIAPEQSFHRSGIVGFASKGPINIPTVVRTKRQLNTIFGFPHPESSDPFLIYAAEQYLRISNELFVVRVADEDSVSNERARTAEVNIPAAGGRIIIQSDTAGPYVFTTDGFFRWRLNGILASKTLVVLADTYTCAELAEELNDQLNPWIDGIEFFCSGGDEIGVRTTFSYGPDATLELVSVQDQIYGSLGDVERPASVTGLGTLMSHAEVTSVLNSYPDDGYSADGAWDFSGLTNLNLIVVVDGTDNQSIDNVVQVISLENLEGSPTTTSDIVDEINDQISNGIIPGGFFAEAGPLDSLQLQTIHQGRDARLLVRDESTTFDIFGFSGITAFGSSPQGVTGDGDIETLGIVVGDSNVGNSITTFTITADSAGIDGNTTQVRMSNDIREGVFRVEVFNQGNPVESWGNLTKDPSSRFYVETYLSLVSDYIRAIDNNDEPAPPLNGTYALSGGSDGIPSDIGEQDSLLIGSPLAFTGLYSLSEPEQIDIDLIAVPGHSSTDVILAMLDVVENYRQDCLAIIDPPFGLTVNEIIQWQNGSHPYNSVRFNSDFAALYWPWLKMRDTFNRIDVWVPPSGSILAVYARNDQLSAPWYAPAGATRGIVPGITDVFSRPSLEERDAMYGNRNAVNPIVQFADVQDFVVWGQKTLQRRPTALDRVNVRRLLFTIEKRIRAASRNLLWEPHDDDFRNSFIDIAERILREIQVGRGLTDFIIRADEELNTPDVIDRNEFRAEIGIQPTRSVEFIFVEFSLHRTGSFSENTDAF